MNVFFKERRREFFPHFPERRGVVARSRQENKHVPKKAPLLDDEHDDGVAAAAVAKQEKREKKKKEKKKEKENQRVPKY